MQPTLSPSDPSSPVRTQAAGSIHPSLADLCPRLVGEYQDHIRAHSRGVRDGAVAETQAVRLLKSWATWLWRRDYYPTDPLARLERPRLTKLHRVPFSEHEVRALLDAARQGPNPVMERALLLLSLDTGARIGELVGARLDDLDLERRVIVFRKTKNGRPRRVFFGVASQADGGPCVVALRKWLAVRSWSEAPSSSPCTPEELRLLPRRSGPALARPQSETPNLFLSADGWPLSTERARRIFHALGESAGVPNVIPHRFRHTAASEFLAAAPGAEHALRSRLGHLSIDVMSDYISISDSTAQQFGETASLSAKWGL
jgi:integrase